MHANPPPICTLQINQTMIQIVEGDITQIEADVIVSSDDIYLTMGGGVSRAIRRAAGDSLVEDVRKQALPRTIGTVVVTTSGRLKARYVFHAITVDFATQPQTDVLVARIVRRILEVGAALEVSDIALPLLGTGTAHLEKKSVLKYILDSAMYYLATGQFAIGKLTLMLWEAADLRSEIEALAQKASSTAPLQRRIAKLKALRQEADDDNELADLLDVRIANAQKELRNAFHFQALDAIPVQQVQPASGASAKDKRKTLREAWAQLVEDTKQAQEKRDIEEQNLQRLQKQVRKGESVPQKIATETEGVRQRIAKIDRELAQLDELRGTYLKVLPLSKTKLRASIVRCYDENELRTFCFEFGGVDYDSLPGSGKAGKARELVDECERHGRLPDLARKLLQERPNISLDDVIELEISK